VLAFPRRVRLSYGGGEELASKSLIDAEVGAGIDSEEEGN